MISAPPPFLCRRKNEFWRTSSKITLLKTLSLLPLSKFDSLLSLSLSSLSRAKPEAMEERKKLPMKYVYVSPRSAGGVGKQERSICRRERQGETDCAMVGRRRRRRRRQQQQQRRRRLFAARTPRMLLLPFVLRSCRPLFEEPTRAPPCIGRTESC